MDVSYTDHSHIIGKGGGNIKQGLVIIKYYYINTYEIPGDLSCQNMILSYVKGERKVPFFVLTAHNFLPVFHRTFHFI